MYIYKTFSFEEIPEAQKLMEVGQVVVRVGKKTSEAVSYTHLMENSSVCVYKMEILMTSIGRVRMDRSSSM